MQPGLSKGETRAKQGSCCQEVSLGVREGFSLSAAFISWIWAGWLTKSKARPCTHTINSSASPAEPWMRNMKTMSNNLLGNPGRKAPACPGFSAGWEAEDGLLYLGREAAPLGICCNCCSLSSSWVLWPDYIKVWVFHTDPAGSELDLFFYCFTLGKFCLTGKLLSSDQPPSPSPPSSPSPSHVHVHLYLSLIIFLAHSSSV